MSTTKKRPSYTAKELEQETGFDRRTIAYYVQEGLLPRVGRRGPRTRYPGLVRDRLLFIRRVREAEEAGEVAAVSLSDMRLVFERVPASLIARVADGEIAVTPELVERASTAFRLPEMRRAVLARRVMAREGPAEGPLRQSPVASPRPEDREWADASEGVAEMDVGMVYDREVGEGDEGDEIESELGDALVELQERARARGARSPTSMDTWTRVEVTPEIALSVRGISNEDRGVVERVRRAILRVMGGVGGVGG